MLSARVAAAVDLDEEITVRLFVRWYALRKLGTAHGVELVRALLQEGLYVWTFESAGDPWGSKTRISMEQLRCLVEFGEIAACRLGLMRKAEMHAAAAVASSTWVSRTA